MVILNVEILRMFGILIAQEPGGTEPYFTFQQVVELRKLRITGERWHETKDHRPWWGKAKEFT